MNMSGRLCLLFGILILLAVPWVGAAEFSPVLENQLATKSAHESISAIVILESPIDIRALDERLHAESASRIERHRTVIEALQFNARQTQPQFAAEFEQAVEDGRMSGFTAYWIDNLFVIRATKEFVESLRSRGDIRFVTENFQTELIRPIGPTGTDRSRPVYHSLDTRTVPPGVVAVGALRVAEELGYTGLGVLVGNMDTGVDGNHPALASRWRGAGGAHPWAECWKDALNTTTFPTANGDHGTHVMGTICGREIDGSDTTWIGCAPNAKWIAHRAVDQGQSDEQFINDVIDGFQWFTDPDGDPETVDDMPDVVQNSWGVRAWTGTPFTQCFDEWNTVILNCEAAGVVVTWSAGNEGTSGLRSPAIYSLNETQIFSVGAVNSTDYSAPYPLASFSSQGPTPCTPAVPNTIKPEISAPGVTIYSSVPGGSYEQSGWSGTSMAGPHVAGVVALMREACPDCDPQTIKETLISTAIRTGYVTAPATENNQFGNGLIDAYAAVLAVAMPHGRVSGLIRDASTLLPLAAHVEVVGGTQAVTASAAGEYWLMLPGDSTYTLRYSLFGYYPQDISVAVSVDDTTYQYVDLVPRPVVTVFTEDFESGATGWSHSSPAGWGDQWHLSTEQSYSATHSYKCGDTGTGTYTNLLDAQLTSPVISDLPEDARLWFWYQIQGETSGLYPDSAYDGGIIEISVDGGAFVQVSPIESYPKTFRWNAGGGNPATGPLRGYRCWSGTVSTWTAASVDLAAYYGQSVQFRWRFGSDQITGYEGWYIDDVRVSGFGVPAPEVPLAVVITVSGDDIILSWEDNGSPAYRIYADTDAGGAFPTLVGETSTNSDTLFGAAASAATMFYIARGWDGQ